MADHGNFALCERERNNLDSLYGQRNTQRSEISRLENQVAIREGEISVAENTLSNILNAIERVGSGMAALGLSIFRRNPLDAARDSVEVAVGLANEEARQRQETENLQRKLANDKWQLQLARDDLDYIDGNIEQTTNVLNANNC